MASKKDGANVANGADWAQRIRLISGLILMVFATMHFLNHSLGIVSLDAMQEAKRWHTAIWRSPPGTILLYGALFLHAGLALYKTATRRTWRIPPWEALQILLGLAIPYYLFLHVVGTRGLVEIFDVRTTYPNVLSLLWPGLALQQSLLMLVVWLHGVIGIHFWLRVRPWYRHAFPWLVFIGITIPLLAQWGWIEASRRMVLSDDVERFLTREHIIWANSVISTGTTVMIVLLSICVAAMAINIVRTFLSSRVIVRYPGGMKLRAAPGATLLEVSRSNNIPHASVCGGRARCSTCRTRILEGVNTLPPPGDREKAVLKRINADENVRLACQIRPTRPLAVQPLLPGRQARGAANLQTDAYHWGVEQPAAIMFVDIRNFTGISENRLSYDVVFMLNRYLDGAAQAITSSGGYVDKFIGDGIMAIFGINDGVRQGARQALEAAAKIQKSLHETNQDLAGHLDAPLKIGIGIHAGQVILGRIGAAGGRGQAPITALGDVVNTASRLEAETKKYGATMITSRQVVQVAGIKLEDEETTEIVVRGRKKPLNVYVLYDLSVLSDAIAAEYETG